ncbi:MAG: DUF1232 domain-containing protein [Calditrichales bacterium]|nr:MAG: DUF1232 domain-containing protein [Calditrichales bacterium]
MDEKQRDFYHKLRAKIESYLKKNDNAYADYLLLAPDLFHLLVKLSMDERVPMEKKAKFLAVIAYFISPLDLLPEMFLGPIGYLDDIALSAYVINQYINETDPAIVRELWAGDQDVLTVLKNIIQAADKFIGSGLWKKLRGQFK